MTLPHHKVAPMRLYCRGPLPCCSLLLLIERETEERAAGTSLVLQPQLPSTTHVVEAR